MTLLGCSEPKQDPRLSDIAGIVSESPEEALSCLDSIDYNGLSGADRYFYDFLTIKAKDKAYVKHTSDSTILKVIDHYTNDKDMYAEALYYGGRVYSDMGDSPTALTYFQKALDNIPDDSSNLNLKANILSQTGRLLNNLRLYDDAVRYVESAIKIGEHYRDTVNIVYDLLLLGHTYLESEKYNLSEHCFNKAMGLSSNLPAYFEARLRMYLARVKYKKGQLDSALNLIRGVPDLVRPNSRNNALAFASKIYLRKELLDTAYAYARELVNSPRSINKETGYQTILSPELSKLIPIDSIYQYLYEFVGLLEDYHNNHQMQLAINQQCFYNYQKHDIEKREAEDANLKLTWWIYGISFICFILAIGVLYYKNRTNKALIDLHIALQNANRLIDNIEDDNIDNANAGRDDAGETPDETDGIPAEDIRNNWPISESHLISSKEIELREKLRDALLSFYYKNQNVGLSEKIIKSEAYKKLQVLIRDKKILDFDDPFWNELEHAVLEASPKFKENLLLLTQSKLTSIDLHTALLVKCRISPGHMSVLVNRAIGTIVSRRQTLCHKIFDKNMSTKVIDGIIRLL